MPLISDHAIYRWWVVFYNRFAVVMPLLSQPHASQTLSFRDDPPFTLANPTSKCELSPLYHSFSLAEAVQPTAPETENRSLNPMSICTDTSSCTSSTKPFAPEKRHLGLLVWKKRNWL